VKAEGFPYLNLHYSMIEDEGLRQLRALGSDFSAWTVNDEENLRKFLQMGIANITTRIPALVVRLRREIQGV